MNRDELPETAAVLVTVAAGIVGIVALCVLAYRVEQNAALACARASLGTDQAIADCYTRRGLPCPDDICPHGAP